MKKEEETANPPWGRGLTWKEKEERAVGLQKWESGSDGGFPDADSGTTADVDVAATVSEPLSGSFAFHCWRKPFYTAVSSQISTQRQPVPGTQDICGSSAAAMQGSGSESPRSLRIQPCPRWPEKLTPTYLARIRDALDSADIPLGGRW
jgi:hypothetical protein